MKSLKEERNQARDPRAWFFSYSVIFSAYWIYKRKPPPGLSGLLGQSPDPSESPRTFAASAANW